jgi:hypothetical protein
VGGVYRPKKKETLDNENLPYFFRRLATVRMCQAARGLARGLISHRDNDSNNCAIVLSSSLSPPFSDYTTAAWVRLQGGIELGRLFDSQAQSAMGRVGPVCMRIQHELRSPVQLLDLKFMSLSLHLENLFILQVLFSIYFFVQRNHS